MGQAQFPAGGNLVRTIAFVSLIFVSALGCRSAPVRGSHFVVVDSDHLVDAAAEAALVDEGEATLAAVGALWGIDPPREPIAIRVVTGGPGCHAGPDGITLQSEHIPLKDLSHELVHFLCGDSWRVVSEGLATWLTERFAEDERRPGHVPIDARALAYLECGLERDLSFAGGRDGMDPRAYVQAASFVGHLLAAYGAERVRVLYEGPPDGYAAAFGRDLEALEDDWRAALEDRVPVAGARYRDFLRRVRLWQSGASDVDPEDT
jgi:hypothetical protein